MQRGRVAHAPAAEKCTRFLFASEFFTFPGDTQCMQCNGSQSEIESILLTHDHSIYRVFTDVLDVLHFCLIF